jgi:hypothetical protein
MHTLLVSEVGRADTHPFILAEEKRRPDRTPTLTLPYTLLSFEDCSLAGNSIHLTYQSCWCYLLRAHEPLTCQSLNVALSLVLISTQRTDVADTTYRLRISHGSVDGIALVSKIRLNCH